MSEIRLEEKVAGMNLEEKGCERRAASKGKDKAKGDKKKKEDGGFPLEVRHFHAWLLLLLTCRCILSISQKDLRQISPSFCLIFVFPLSYIYVFANYNLLLKLSCKVEVARLL